MIFRFILIILSCVSVWSKPVELQSNQCRPEVINVTPEQNFNLREFVGQWFVLARTQGPWKGHNWAGSVSNFRLSDGGSIEGRYSLYIRNPRMCMPGMNAELRPTDLDGRFGATLAAHTPIRGDYTVYRQDGDFAITHECYKKNSNGGCARNGRVVAILGRRRETPPTDLMREANRLVCRDESINLVDHTVDCSDEVQWPRNRRDIVDAEKALDTVNVHSLPQVSVEENPIKCPPLDCAFGDCIAGSELDELGCPTCDCLKLTGPSAVPCKHCQNHCEQGHYTDRYGCDSCICKPRCPPNPCTKKCSYGYAKDSFLGCPICECREVEFCPELNCVPCINGSKPDEHGCPTCNCLGVNCPAFKCTNNCEYGYKKNSEGCETCECKMRSDICSFDPKCNLYCPLGFVRRSECMSCECIEPSGDVTESDAGYPMSGDGLDEDHILENEDDTEIDRLKYVKDERKVNVSLYSEDSDSEIYLESPVSRSDGPVVCPKLACPNRCINGRSIDSSGCLTCACKVVECPKLFCSSIIRCDFGQIKDENGCDTCNCVVGDAIRGFEAGEEDGEVARTVIGEYPQKLHNFAGEQSIFENSEETNTELSTETSTQDTPPLISESKQDFANLINNDMASSEVVFSCPELECDSECPGGRILNENGCQTCKCDFQSNDSGHVSLNCPSLTCVNRCESGRKVDEYGCLTCECREKCPDVICDENCMKIVFNGCPMCSCNEPCLPSECGDLKCPNGYRKNEMGCEVCQCACPELQCWDGPCQHGSKLDIYGCETCDCLRPKRPLMACPFLSCKDGPCRQGWWPYSNGCASCQCKKHELESCKSKQCENVCESYVFDDQGCQTCECEKSLECPEFQCELDCLQYRLDSFGCQQCACACPELKCVESCSGGYVLDESGCSTCECQSDVVYDLPELDEPAAENFENTAADFKALDFQKNCIAPTCWDGPCVFGSVPDLDDCDTCICFSSPERLCETQNCPLACEFGSYFDRYGCETCNCKPDPALNCPDLSTCPLRCANGFKETDSGCKICECFVLVPPEVLCPKIACDKACEYSYKVDSEGCLTCECGCGQPICPEPCLYGSELDQNGCETCKCKRPDKPEISCGLLDCRGRECPNDYRVDQHGCHTCECEVDTVIKSSIPRQKDGCTPDLSLCPFACMYGYVERDGCLTCECESSKFSHIGPSCPLMDCDPCEFGYIEDSRGCRTCRCKLPVEELKCLKDCTELCHYNYVGRKDENGCMLCTCIEHKIEKPDETFI